MSIDAGLYIVGTPIGNLKDISIRAIETLQAVDIIYAEDTRHTRKLTQAHNISTQMKSCHKFNESKKSEEIINRIQNGEAIAIVSDSGMPGISDPGSRLVQSCFNADVPITCIPGPTALTTAMAMIGYTETGFIFAGFLPHKSGGRKKELEYWSETKLPVVFYESPYRLIKLTEEIESYLNKDRELFVLREMTKKFEEIIRGTPKEIRSSFKERSVKGELVVILMPDNK